MMHLESQLGRVGDECQGPNKVVLRLYTCIWRWIICGTIALLVRCSTRIGEHCNYSLIQWDFWSEVGCFGCNTFHVR